MSTGTVALSRIDHNRYYAYEDFTAHLHNLARAFPNLATLRSIGASHQGRSIWAMTLTNSGTGPAESKPAFYIDANNHGEEIVTSAAALYLIDDVLHAYGHDPVITELLDTRTLYVLPRINPDGAEISMATPYRTVGNGRYFPGDEQPTGLHIEDINGDGRVLQMRMQDPGGEWKVSDAEPRLMTLRAPGEIGGTYYRLLPEGIVRNWDGVSAPIVKPRHGNLNRQFPVNWVPASGEYGAGALPLEEPEAAAVAQFLLSHPNITGVHAYHSHSGVILRPSGYRRDVELPPEDVELHQIIGEVGSELTGYPVISTFEDFTESLRSPRHGTLTDWTYEQLGLVSFCPEFWDVETEAGTHKPQFFPHRTQREEEEIALLRWVDEHASDGYVDWSPFDHPQFGAIDLGGWDPFLVQRNPPPQFLERVARPTCRFSLHHAAASPLVRITSLRSEALGHGFHRVVATIQNLGYLPTHITQQALDIGIASPVTVSLAGNPPVNRLMGAETQEIGHLAGRATRRTLYDAWRRPWGESSRVAEWLVHVPEGEQAAVLARSESEKGGTHEVRLTITS